jgi:hypothetical protein
MLTDLLLQAQAMGPESCSLTGICVVLDAGSRIPSGVMFTAVGMVGFGVWYWRRGKTVSSKR